MQEKSVSTKLATPDTDRTLLAVFAHPDDESFGPGGTLARYASEGVNVWLVCGTDGDAGTVDAEMLANYASTSQLRAAELCCAAETLGLKGVDWLGYRDSGMAGSPDNQHPGSLYQAPMEDVVGQIVASIRRHRPQVVICDNQYGGYGHPDHIKLHQATVAAFRAAGDPSQYPGDDAPFQPQRLFFTAFSAGIFKFLVRLLPLLRQDPRRFGRNHDIDLVEIMTWETPVHARVDVRRYLSVKDAASACHASQGGGNGGPFRIIPGFLRKRWFGHETFMQGVPEPRPSASMITDLFAGVEV
ncbi:MAG: PIG-L family deacetylase [Anaerolineae bacterium]|nr:PIG-L family deacetylase [Anaerolineae bacterium]